jgi:hypothetical protein
MPPINKKRKSTATLPTQQEKKRKTPKKSAKGDKSSIFPFLSLPVELRDEVYEYLAASTSAILSRKCKTLVSSSPLLHTSRQIRAEFSSILNTHSTSVTTTVTDFNFAHVVRYLNSLSVRELDFLPARGAPSDRKFIIELQATKDCPSNPEGLRKWLLRCDDPKKAGTNVEMAYRISENRSRAGNFSQVADKMDVWTNRLGSGRLKDEVVKIKDATTFRPGGSHTHRTWCWRSSF